jgi:hypothetical protein
LNSQVIGGFDTHTIRGIVGTAYEETPEYSSKSEGILFRGVPCLKTGALEEWYDPDLISVFDPVGRAHDGGLMQVSKLELWWRRITLRSPDAMDSI